MSEPDLPSLLRHRPAEALAVIYDRHAAGLYAYACSLTASTRLAEDLVQDLFVQVAEQAAQVATATDLPAYLARMLRNRWLDRQRRERRWTVLREQGGEEDGQGALDTRDAVHAAIAHLPPAQREVVVLKHWHDLTFAAIAEVLDLSPDTVASRYRYARARLEEALHEHRV